MLAGGRVSGACIVCGRTDRSSEQRLQADWSVERAALTGGLAGLACSAYTRTGRWKVQPACRWTGQSSIPALAGGLVWRPSSAAGGLVSRACIACGGLAGRACSACRRAGRSSLQRLQADCSVERAALTGRLAGLACSACRPTGRSEVPPRLQVDWSVQHTGVSKRAGLATVQRCWRTVQSCVHRLRGAWPVVRAVLAGGLVDRPCSACRRAGRSSVQRLQAGWSVERAARKGGLVDRACSASMRSGRPSMQCLQAGGSVEHASFAGGLIGRASSACRRTGRSSVQRLQADWPV